MLLSEGQYSNSKRTKFDNDLTAIEEMEADSSSMNTANQDLSSSSQEEWSKESIKELLNEVNKRVGVKTMSYSFENLNNSNTIVGYMKAQLEGMKNQSDEVVADCLGSYIYLHGKLSEIVSKMSDNEKLLYAAFLQPLNVNTNPTNSNPSASASSFAQSFGDQSSSRRQKEEELALEEKQLALDSVKRIEAELKETKKKIKLAEGSHDEQQEFERLFNAKKRLVLRFENSDNYYTHLLEEEKGLNEKLQHAKADLKDANIRLDKANEVLKTARESYFGTVSKDVDKFKEETMRIFGLMNSITKGQETIKLILELCNQNKIPLTYNEFDAKKQSELLGHLNNPATKFPIIKGEIDMRVFTPDETKVNVVTRKASNEMNKKIHDRKGTTKGGDFYFFVAVSGSGKTSTIFDLARENYVIYIQCTPREFTQVPGTDANSLSDSNSKQVRVSKPDHSFVKLYETFMMEHTNQAGKFSKTEAYNIGRRLTAAYYLSKLIFLCSMQISLERLPTPWEFLIQQLNSDSLEGLYFLRFLNWTLLEIEKLLNLLMSYLEMCLKDQRFNLILAIDEIEVGSNLIVEVQREESMNEKKQESFLNIMANTAELLMTTCKWDVIFAGTGTTHQQSEMLLTSIGKRDDEIHKYSQNFFPMANLEDCKNILLRLNLDSSTRKEISELQGLPTIINIDDKADSLQKKIMLYMVGARFRILTGVVERINMMKTGSLSQEPKLILQNAIDASVSAHIHRLAAILRRRIDQKYDPTLTEDNKMKYIKYLYEIYTGALVTNGRACFPHQHSPFLAHTDLLQLGIAGTTVFDFNESIEKESMIKNRFLTVSFQITERFVIEAIKTLFTSNSMLIPKIQRDNFEQIVIMINSVFKVFGEKATMKGNLVEHLILLKMSELINTCSYVGDLPFIRHGCYVPTNAKNLEKWKKIQLNHTSQSAHVANVEFMSGTDNEITKLADSAFITYSPENNCRPDGIIMLPKEADDEPNCKRAIVIGCAVYGGNVPSDKQKSQMRSTDLSRAYLLEMEDKINVESKRSLWIKHGMHKTRAIRIQICLPQAAVQRGTATNDTKKRIGGHKVKVVGTGNKEEYELDENEFFEFNEENEDLIVKLDMNSIHYLVGTSKAPEDELDFLYRLLAIATQTDLENWPGTFSPPDTTLIEELKSLLRTTKDPCDLHSLKEFYEKNSKKSRKLNNQELIKALDYLVNNNQVVVDSGLYKYVPFKKSFFLRSSASTW